MNNAQEPVLHHFSTVFHIQAFANLDRFCQQEIISDLATQIGTNPKTRNIGLKTMVSMIIVLLFSKKMLGAFCNALTDQNDLLIFWMSKKKLTFSM